MPEQAFFCMTDVSPLSDRELFATGMDLVPEARREKVLRYRFEADRRRSLGAGLLLCYALKRQGVILSEDSIAEGDNQKPFLTGRNDLFFNLSHAKDRALCVTSPVEVGCDIEAVSTFRMNLAERFFAEEEVQTLSRQTDPDARTLLFYRLWTLKESFLKATGRGLSLPMNEFTIVFDDTDAPHVLHFLNQKQYLLTEYSVPDGYCCSLCREQTDCPPPTLTECGIRDVIGELMKKE